MNDPFAPVTEEEFDLLRQFLLDRVDDDADTDGKDEGVLDIPELDGLFTAVVSGPVMIPPSQWLPAVWGDFEPVWESEEEFTEILSLMIRYMNEIAGMLSEQPENFEPVFHTRQVDGKSCMIVDEWCYGYMRGVELAADHWNLEDQEMIELLAPIVAFSDTAIREDLESLDANGIETLQSMIAPNIRVIHSYWQQQRKAPPENSRVTAPGVGRNDPCPCGSGKKYKKCCLN